MFPRIILRVARCGVSMMFRTNSRKILLLCLAGVCALSVGRVAHADVVTLTLDDTTSNFFLPEGIYGPGMTPLFGLAGSWSGDWSEGATSGPSESYDDIITSMSGGLTATVLNAAAVDAFFGTTGSNANDIWQLNITGGNFDQGSDPYAGGTLNYSLVDTGSTPQGSGIFSFSDGLAIFTAPGGCPAGGGTCTPNNFDYDPITGSGLFAMVGSDTGGLTANIGGEIKVAGVAATPIPPAIALFVSALFALFGIGRRLQTSEETS